MSPRGTAESTDEALWDRTLNINLKGAWLGIKAALPHLKQTRGTIINVGSTRGTRPMPGLFSYVASKAGLLGITQQVAVEYLLDGITCNLLAPGWVDTPGEPRAPGDARASRLPGRLAEPAEPRQWGPPPHSSPRPRVARRTG
ncbi:MAG: SDR family oxidoreductase [Isosphaeraceae bacterium]